MKSKKLIVKLIAALCALGLGTAAQAASATYTWSGAGEDKLWTNTANWSCDDGTTTAYPKDGDTAVFPATFTDGVTVQFSTGLCGDKPGSGPAITMDCNVTLESTSSAVQWINPNSVTGSGTLTLSNMMIRTPTNYGSMIATALVIKNTVILYPRGGNANVIVSGAVSGNGTLSCAGDSNKNKWIYFKGDMSGFTGTFQVVAFNGTTALYGNDNTVTMPNATVDIRDSMTLYLLGTCDSGKVTFGRITGTGKISKSYAGDTTLVLNSDTDAEASVALTGTGTWSIEKSGSGTQTLTGAGSTLSNVTVKEGSLGLPAGAEVSSVSLASGSKLVFDGATILDQGVITLLTIMSASQTALTSEQVSLLNVDETTERVTLDLSTANVVKASVATLSHYCWTGASTASKLITDNDNWVLTDGEKADAAPGATDTLEFPSTFSGDALMEVGADFGGPAMLVINCPTTIQGENGTQRTIYFGGISGSSPLTLNNIKFQTITYGKPSVTAPLVIGENVYFYARGGWARIYYHGAITGSGTLRLHGDNSNNQQIYCDLSGFTGTLDLDYNTYIYTNGEGGQKTMDLSGATLDLAGTFYLDSSCTNYVLKVGALTGTGTICNNTSSAVTLEVGARGDTVSTSVKLTTGATTTDAWTIHKVGSGVQTFTTEGIYTGVTVSVSEGELVLPIAAKGVVTCADGTELGREDDTYAYYMHPVAQIGSVKYGLIDLALAARQSGEAMTILDDCTLPDDTEFDDLTIVEGATVTYSYNSPLQVNGTLSANNLSLHVTDIPADGTYTIATAGTLTLTGETAVTLDGYGVRSIDTSDNKIAVTTLPNITDCVYWYEFNGNMEPKDGYTALTWKGVTGTPGYDEDKALILEKGVVIPYAEDAALVAQGDNGGYTIAMRATTGTPGAGYLVSVGKSRGSGIVTTASGIALATGAGTIITNIAMSTDNLTYHNIVLVSPSKADTGLTRCHDLWIDGVRVAYHVTLDKIQDAAIGLGCLAGGTVVDDGVRIDDFRYFDRALTDDQVAYYAEQLPRKSVNVTDTTFTWTGNAGDNQWSTPGNWKYAGAASGLVPGADDAISFTGDATVILEEAKTVKSLAQTAGTLTLSFVGSAIKAGTALTITGTKPASLDVGSADDRYTFSYANGKITAAYADSIYVWQLSTREGEWTNAVNWKVNGATATTAPTADDNVLIDHAVTIDTTGDCYGSNITMCASVTLTGAGPLLLTGTISGASGCTITLDNAVIRSYARSAVILVPINIPEGTTNYFYQSVDCDLYVKGDLTGKGHLVCRAPGSDNVNSGVFLQGDNSAFAGEVEYFLSYKSNKGVKSWQARTRDAVSYGKSSSAKAAWSFYINATDRWNSYVDRNNGYLFPEINGVYEFGSIRALLPNTNYTANAGVTLRVGARDEDSFIKGYWKDSAGYHPTIEWVAPTATFTNMTEHLGTLVLSGGGTVMLPATNYFPTAVTFTGKGGFVDFSSSIYSSPYRHDFRLRIVNSTAQVALNLGPSDKIFNSAFLDSSNTGGYRKTGSNTIGFSLANGAGYSGLTTVAEGKLALPQGLVLNGGLEVTGADAKVKITNMTEPKVGAAILTWEADESAKALTLDDFELESTIPDRLLLEIGDLGSGQMGLVVIANPAYTYIWTDASGDHLWSNPANWEVNGETATTPPEAGFAVEIPKGATIVVAYGLNFSDFGEVTLGAGVKVVVMFTAEGQTYTIPDELKGFINTQFTGCGPFAGYTVSGEETVTSGARVPSTFTWAVSDGEWSTAANWLVGGFPTAVTPVSSDAAEFPASLKTTTFRMDKDDFRITNVWSGTAVTITGAKTLRCNLFKGYGTLVLSNALLAAWTSADMIISNNIEVVANTTNLITLAKKRNCEVYGNFTGSGLFRWDCRADGAGTWNGLNLHGDNTAFEGTFEQLNGYGGRSGMGADSCKATSANAVWLANSQSKNNTDQPFFSKGADGTYYFGAIQGAIQGGYAKPDFEIGSRVDYDSSFCFIGRTDGNGVTTSCGITKVGSSHLSVRCSGVGNNGDPSKMLGSLVLKGGTTWIQYVPTTALTFASDGATLQLGTNGTDAAAALLIDPSAVITNSTSAIRFDDQGTNCTWATALNASNIGGLIKLGDGTLTLTQPVAMTNGVWGVKAGKVIVPKSGFDTQWVTDYTTCTANGNNYELTYKTSTQLAIEAGEGTVQVGAITDEAGTTYLEGGYIVPGKVLTIQAKISDDDFYKNLVMLVISGTTTNTISTTISATGIYTGTYTVKDADCGPEAVLTVAFSATPRTLATINENFSSSGFGEIYYEYTGDGATSRYVGAKGIRVDMDDYKSATPFQIHFTVNAGFRLREVKGASWVSGSEDDPTYVYTIHDEILDGDPALYIKLQSLTPLYVTVPDVENATVAVTIPDPLDCGETNRADKATVYTVYLDAHLIVDYTAVNGTWYLDGTSHFDYEKIGESFTVPAPTAKVAGVTIGGKGYKDFRAARAAFKSGDTILIANDYAFEGWGAGTSVAIPEDVTIDLGGGEYDVSLSVVTNHTVTIQNGTLRTAGHPTIQVMSGKAILSALTVEAADATALYICEGGEAQLADATTLKNIIAEDYEGEVAAVYVDQSSIFTADAGTTITSEGDVAVYQDVGAVVTLNGELNGYYAVYVDGGKLVMTGASFGEDTIDAIIYTDHSLEVPDVAIPVELVDYFQIKIDPDYEDIDPVYKLADSGKGYWSLVLSDTQPSLVSLPVTLAAPLRFASTAGAESNLASVTVAPTEEVEDALETAAEEKGTSLDEEKATYAKLFTVSASGATVAASLDPKAVQETLDEGAGQILSEVITVTGDGEASAEITVSAQPGLYYGLAASDTLEGLAAEKPAMSLATGTTVELSADHFPTSGFYMLKVSATPEK